MNNDTTKKTLLIRPPCMSIRQQTLQKMTGTVCSSGRVTMILRIFAGNKPTKQSVDANTTVMNKRSALTSYVVYIDLP